MAAEMCAFAPPNGDLFEGYVRYKRSLGYSIPLSYQYVLRDVSELLLEWGPTPEVLGRAAAEDLSARRPGESVTTQCKRIAIVRQLGRYLRTLGYEAYLLPEGLVRDTSTFVPRIVTADEMSSILSASDSMGADWRSLILRILWCCGLRLGEACRLELGDVDLALGTLLVRHAKGDRTRLVPMSESLCRYVSEAVGCRVADGADGSSPLMPTPSGRPRGVGNAHASLAKVYARAGVLTTEGRPIRTHDLRHSFAVHSLERMVAMGDDPYVALPKLAEYMGHADIKSTERYLRLTEGSMTSVVEAQAGTSALIFGGLAR
jgi:integrase